MKKLKLNLDEIKVESFEVKKEKSMLEQGTIYGQISEKVQTYGCCTGIHCSEIYTCEGPCYTDPGLC